MPNTTPTELTVALVQQTCSNDREQNLTKSCEEIRHAAEQGAQLVLLQELHTSPYFCQTEDTAQFDLAEPIPGPSTEQLGALAAELGVVIVASLFERRAVGLYHNTVVVLDTDGSIAGRYRKMHIPEAELLLYPTAIGWDPNDDTPEQARQLDAWFTVQRSHAIANGVPVLSCNRVGHEADPSGTTDGINFWGSSFACGPQGEVLVRASGEAETLITRIDCRRSEDVRRIWPFLRDRRIDAYDPILRRYDD
jgi:N-carbamoylputrescine amidase